MRLQCILTCETPQLSLPLLAKSANGSDLHEFVFFDSLSSNPGGSYLNKLQTRAIQRDERITCVRNQQRNETRSCLKGKKLDPSQERSFEMRVGKKDPYANEGLAESDH